MAEIDSDSIKQALFACGEACCDVMREIFAGRPFHELVPSLGELHKGLDTLLDTAGDLGYRPAELMKRRTLAPVTIDLDKVDIYLDGVKVENLRGVKSVHYQEGQGLIIDGKVAELRQK